MSSRGAHVASKEPHSQECRPKESTLESVNRQCHCVLLFVPACGAPFMQGKMGLVPNRIVQDVFAQQWGGGAFECRHATMCENFGVPRGGGDLIKVS